MAGAKNYPPPYMEVVPKISSWGDTETRRNGGNVPSGEAGRPQLQWFQSKLHSRRNNLFLQVFAGLVSRQVEKTCLLRWVTQPGESISVGIIAHR